MKGENLAFRHVVSIFADFCSSFSISKITTNEKVDDMYRNYPEALFQRELGELNYES